MAAAAVADDGMTKLSVPLPESGETGGRAVGELGASGRCPLPLTPPETSPLVCSLEGDAVAVTVAVVAVVTVPPPPPPPPPNVVPAPNAPVPLAYCRIKLLVIISTPPTCFCLSSFVICLPSSLVNFGNLLSTVAVYVFFLKKKNRKREKKRKREYHEKEKEKKT